MLLLQNLDNKLSKYFDRIDQIHAQQERGVRLSIKNSPQKAELRFVLSESQVWVINDTLHSTITLRVTLTG